MMSPTLGTLLTPATTHHCQVPSEEDKLLRRLQGRTTRYSALTKTTSQVNIVKLVIIIIIIIIKCLFLKEF